MATINPDEIPLDKIDAVIERLQKEKDARINARVSAGEAVKIPVSVVGDQDVEEAKARALRDAHLPPGMAHYFHVTQYRYQDMPDGSPNPMNKPPSYNYDHVIEIHTGVNRHPNFGRHTGDLDFTTTGKNTEMIQSGRQYDSDRYPRPPLYEPAELIVGEPRPAWTEMRRPGPTHHGEIAEGHYIVVDGRVHLSDELGKAIPGYSDIAGLDPMSKARKLLRSKAQRDRPDEFWKMSPVAPTHGGW